jgi:hypothetical protein
VAEKSGAKSITSNTLRVGKRDPVLLVAVVVGMIPSILPNVERAMGPEKNGTDLTN